MAATIGTWVTIRAGTFVMGSPRDEVGHDADETQHRVVLTRDFEIQTTEVTQAQFEEVMGRNPSYFSGCGGGCPVERVSWWDAVAYVNALSLLAGLPECYELIGCRGTPGGGCDGEPDCYGDYQCDEVRFASRHCWSYRLPTEAEWEYMARAGTTTATYNGDLDLDWIETWSCLFSGVLDPIAWFCANSEVEYDRAWDCSSWSGIRRCGPNEFATRTPNAWGLHDMLGNVWELCHDWYVEDLGGDPVGNPVGPESGEFRVLRGGSWIDNSWLTRAANRNGRGPSIRFNDTGFRPSRSLP
ncbi:MAG: formylglycine-generating enzyme family protein [Armatimonadetes bacterium]|nr:formylglycine-generating enzyme family protein [Armatimonadota bacterium]